MTKEMSDKQIAQRVAAGKIGGTKKVPKGFALSGKAKEAGRLGGRTSRRGKKITSKINDIYESGIMG